MICKYNNGLILSHLVLFYLIWSYLVSFGFILSHLVLFCLIWSYFVSFEYHFIIIWNKLYPKQAIPYD